MLDGGAKADVMRGNSGPDTVSYVTRSKSVFVTLSEGDHNDGEKDEKDHITSTENVLGGSGDDQITGYSALNILAGNGGKDKITGLAGNDVLLGGSGDDQMQGDCHIVPVVHTFCDQTGNDRIQGGVGNDELFGDSGKDTIQGEAGDDYLLGANDDDDIQGGDDKDVLWGDNGGRSAPHTGNGADKLSGGAGDDELKGDNGNDTLDDGPGNDELDGMGGDDRLLSDPLGSDEISGDAGVDTLDLSDRTADLKITIGAGGRNDGQAGRERPDTAGHGDLFDGLRQRHDRGQLGRPEHLQHRRGRRHRVRPSGHRHHQRRRGHRHALVCALRGPFARLLRREDRRVRRRGAQPRSGRRQMNTFFTGFERFVGGNQADRLIGAPVRTTSTASAATT